LKLKKAEKILKKLDLNPEEWKSFIKNTSGSKSSKKTYTNLDKDRFLSISSWYHLAILNLVKLDKFELTGKWVSNKLGINISQAKIATERVLEQGLLKKSKKRWLRTDKSLYVGDDTESFAIQKFHTQMMDKAKDSLKLDPSLIRDMSCLMMAIDPEKIPEARKKIRKFYNEMMDLMEQKPRRQLYALQIQLFPLTKENEE
jgi:uncharacterized protein (TIGR02147 family)